MLMHPAMIRSPDNQQGVTLTELMVASAIAVVVVLGLGSIDSTRIRMTEEVRRSSNIAPPERSRAAIAALRLAQDLERADRVRILNTGIPGCSTCGPFTGPPGRGSIQIRIPEMNADNAPCTGCVPVGPNPPPPPPCCLQIPANYRWVQHKRVQGPSADPLDELRYYATPPGCGSSEVRAGQITSLTFQFIDQAPPPPGGDACGPQDENLLGYELTWDDGAGRTQTFRGAVAIRAGAYTNLNATCSDSGAGLVQAGVSDPPAICDAGL